MKLKQTEAMVDELDRGGWAQYRESRATLLYHEEIVMRTISFERPYHQRRRI
ncbi:hypothetical protein [Bradyrhizobium lupini]|uniref:hypothetical protein n=1 Tax=Rhizobium lupini TaxID=136996 RepID=UPI000310D041